MKAPFTYHVFSQVYYFKWGMGNWELVRPYCKLYYSEFYRVSKIINFLNCPTKRSNLSITTLRGFSLSSNHPTLCNGYTFLLLQLFSASSAIRALILPLILLVNHFSLFNFHSLLQQTNTTLLASMSVRILCDI